MIWSHPAVFCGPKCDLVRNWQQCSGRLRNINNRCTKIWWSVHLFRYNTSDRKTAKILTSVFSCATQSCKMLGKLRNFYHQKFIIMVMTCMHVLSHYISCISSSPSSRACPILERSRFHCPLPPFTILSPLPNWHQADVEWPQVLFNGTNYLNDEALIAFLRYISHYPQELSVSWVDGIPIT